jgi:hypothetical protein
MTQKSFTASATGAVAGPVDAGSGKTYRNFTLRVISSAPDCVVALETSPDGTTWTEQDRVIGPNWASSAYHHARREARVNVINLGTGAPPLGAVICYS